MAKIKDCKSIRKEMVVNKDTEEIHVDKITTKAPPREGKDEPDFLKTYINTVLLNKNISINRNPILIELLKLMPYASSDINYFALNKSIKERIAKQVDLSLQTVNNAITEFAKSKILLRLNRGLYQMNPQYFGKKEWQNITKIALTMVYSDEGKTIKSEIIYK